MKLFIRPIVMEYKKEFSSDLLDKYGGQPKKSISMSNKKQKRNRKVKPNSSTESSI